MSNKMILEDMFNSLLKEVHPQKLIKNSCRLKDDILYINDKKTANLKNKKVYVVGSGKAVLPMALGIEEILEDKIEKFFLVGAYENSLNLANLNYIKSTHPLPFEQSIKAAKGIKKILNDLKEDDILIYLLSGGNSALVELPQDNITLEEFQKTTELMIKGAMPIEAINCVRKHISQVKGGRLGSFTKAETYVLTLSDVIGDDLEAIGSAPLYFDKTTFKDAINYLKEFELFEDIPLSVKNYLDLGVLGKVEDTLKFESKNIRHFILGSNTILLEKAKELLEKKGIKTFISNKLISGDVEKVSNELINFCKNDFTKKECYIFGGEATVKVKGMGKGGRNQHLVLSFLNSFPKDKNITFLSAASDGIDGNSDACGAIINRDTLIKIEELKLDLKSYLDNFDSNSFFQKSGDLLIPGPTHNNMLDIVIILIDK